MHLLDAGGVVGRHHQKGIGETAHPAAVAAAEARRHGIQRSRRLQRPDDILAVAGGGNPDDHVAGAAKGLDLAREQVVETVVVAAIAVSVEVSVVSASAAMGARSRS